MFFVCNPCQWTCVATWHEGDYLACCNCCFHVVKFALISVFSLLESPVPGVSDTVKSQLRSRVAKLKKHDSKGVQIVLKLLANWRRILDTLKVILGAFSQRSLPSLSHPQHDRPSHNPTPLAPWKQGWVVHRNGFGSLVLGEMPNCPDHLTQSAYFFRSTRSQSKLYKIDAVFVRCTLYFGKVLDISFN